MINLAWKRDLYCDPATKLMILLTHQEAGLNLATNTIEPKELMDLECPKKQEKRKKRSADDIDLDIGRILDYLRLQQKISTCANLYFICVIKTFSL